VAAGAARPLPASTTCGRVRRAMPMPRVTLDRIVAGNEPPASAREHAPAGTKRSAPGGPGKAEPALRACKASNMRALSRSIPPRSGGWLRVISRTLGNSGSAHDVIAAPLAADGLVGQAGDLLGNEPD